MRVQLFQPPPPLARYVELLTWYEGYMPDYQHERILPQGVVELIIDLTEPPKFIYDNASLAVSQTCRNAWVSGLRHEFITISAIPGSSMMVVRFREGMAHAALHLPLGLLKNQVLDADLLLNPAISRLREQLLNAPSPEQKFAFTLAFLTERIRQRPDIHPGAAFSVQKILENPAQVTVDELVRRTGWSHKHLIAVFDKYVGVSPKEFVRITRFQQVVATIGSQASVDWMQLLHSCGYYDQAHFIKDFKRFSGLSPEHYLSARGDDLNYLPMR
ncbi:MAG: helix-turn-helix transcriptional regulator [Lewinellaceae bacterium]|nr:helix-turn-helix transcriptional regulator [Lewinellaceae bacterium]